MNIILGPSHVIRLHREVKNSNDIEVNENNKFITRGGMPLWCDYVESELKKNYDPGKKIYVIVGDFRLGNKAVHDDLHCTYALYGIDKDSINQEVDFKCYNRMIAILDNWVEKYNVSLLFWSLAIREHKNKIDKKYINNDGVYEHPIWNLSTVEERYRDNVISMNLPCSICPDMLEIDSSNHPSYVGYCFLKSLFFKKLSVEDSLLNAMRYHYYVSNITTNSRMILCGVSPLYRGVKLYSDKRLLVFPKIDIYSAEDALFNKFGKCDVLLYFANSTDLNSLRFLPKAHYKKKYIINKDAGAIHMYEMIGDEVINIFSYTINDHHLEITQDKLNFEGLSYMMKKIIDVADN